MDMEQSGWIDLRNHFGLLRVSLHSSLIGAPIPLDDFYVLVFQLEAWRNGITSVFKQEEAKTPDDSKINQQKSRIRLICLYAKCNPCLIYVHPIDKYFMSLNPNPYI